LRALVSATIIVDANPFKGVSLDCSARFHRGRLLQDIVTARLPENPAR
jgi:hypothetical protein